MRRDTHGVPLEPAVRAKEWGHRRPLLRLGRGEGEHCRLHTAGLPQGDDEMPCLAALACWRFVFS